MNYPTDYVEALKYCLALSEIEKAEVMDYLARRHTCAITLLRSWCAGNGDERFVTKEQVRELIEATGDFLKDEK